MNDKEIYLKIKEWIKDKKEVAIANVVETWGSSPRPIGSIMAVNNKHDIIGSVSGGCVENFVYGKALEVIKSNKVETLDFGVSNSQAWDVGLTCGGKIKVFLEKISYSDITYIEKINNVFSNGGNILVATKLQNGERELIDNIKDIKNESLKNNFPNISQSTKSGLKKISGELWFLKFFKNNIKIVIVGAVHIAEPLIYFANKLAYEIHLIDPRNSFNEKKFNNVKVYKDWPDEALKEIVLDENTALVTLTHDPKLDDPALEYSLKKKVFYIGCLGSNKTHNSRMDRLKKKGISMNDLKKLHGPVGLDIAAKTPTEIAISIISQIIEVKNKIYA